MVAIGLPPVVTTIAWNTNAAHTAAAPRPAMMPSSQFGRRELLDLPPHEQHHRDVTERIKGQVEGIRQRGRRGRRAANGLDGQYDVAGRPTEQADAQGERHGPDRPVREGPPEAQPDRDDLDAAHEPPVEPWPVRGGWTDDQGDEKTEEKKAQQGVGGPEQGPRPGDRLGLLVASRRPLMAGDKSHRKEQSTVWV